MIDMDSPEQVQQAVIEALAAGGVGDIFPLPPVCAGLSLDSCEATLVSITDGTRSYEIRWLGIFVARARVFAVEGKPKFQVLD